MDNPKGIISINRVYGRRPCFGTNHISGHFIEIVVSQADERDGHISPANQLVVLRMAMHQYIELISSLNVGDGTPCTLQYIKGPYTSYKPSTVSGPDVLRQEVDNEFQELNNQVQHLQAQVKVLLDKGKANKKELSNLYNLTGKVTTMISNDAPDLFARGLEMAQKHIANVKSDFLAYISRLIP